MYANKVQKPEFAQANKEKQEESPEPGFLSAPPQFKFDITPPPVDPNEENSGSGGSSSGPPSGDITANPIDPADTGFGMANPGNATAFQLAEDPSADLDEGNYMDAPAFQLKSAPGNPLLTTAQRKSEPHTAFQFKSEEAQQSRPGDNQAFQPSIQMAKSGFPVQRSISGIPNQGQDSGGNEGNLMNKMGSAMGADFSNVNIHTNSIQAKSVGAKAFAQGNDVHFAPGQFNPSTQSGQELIGHELSHVVQQRAGRVKPTSERGGVPINDDKSLEQEADVMGKKAAQFKMDSPPVQQKSLGSVSSSPAQMKVDESAPNPDVEAKAEKEPKKPEQKEEAPKDHDNRFSLPSAKMDPKTEDSQTDAKAGELEGDKKPTTKTPQGEEAEIQEDKDSEPEKEENEGMMGEQDPRFSEIGTPIDKTDKKDAQDKQEKEDEGKAAEKEGENQLESEEAEKEQASNEESKEKEGAEEGGKEGDSPEGEKDSEEGGEEKEELPKDELGKDEPAAKQGESPTKELVNAAAGEAPAPMALGTGNTGVEIQETGLQTTEAEVQRLGSMVPNFSLPKVDKQGQVIQKTQDPQKEKEEELEQKRMRSQQMASGFLSGATSKVGELTSLAQEVPSQIQMAVDQTISSIRGSIAAKTAETTAAFAQLKSDAQAKADEVKSQMEADHEALVTTIEAKFVTESERLLVEHDRVKGEIDAALVTQFGELETLYSQADKDYRAKGVEVGGEALSHANGKASDYRSKVTGKKDSFLKGYFTDNKWKARAGAAEDVGKGYQESLIEEGNKQADKAMEGKAKDIENATTFANANIDELRAAYDSALELLESKKQSTLDEALAAKDQLVTAVEDKLDATITDLDSQESAQISTLNSVGDGQISATADTGTQIINTLQSNISSAADQILSGINDFAATCQSMEVPDPDAFQGVIAEAMAQVESSVNEARETIFASIAESQASINANAQATATQLATISQGGIESATQTKAEFDANVDALGTSATEVFGQYETLFNTDSEAAVNTSVEGFNAKQEAMVASFESSNVALKGFFTESVASLAEGLRGSITNTLDSDIIKYADEAASKVKPAWKSALKILLIIVVCIVVAVVIGPAVIGAVGAFAGAMGASAGVASAVGAIAGGAIVGAASGAVIQVGSNLIDGEPLMQGVGSAMVAGAIGGALGGAGGLIGNSLANAGRLGSNIVVQTGAKWGIDIAADVTGDVLGRLATGQEITLESLANNAAFSFLGSRAMDGLSAMSPRVRSLQASSFEAGTNFGTRAGGAVNNAAAGLGFGPKPTPPPPVPRTGIEQASAKGYSDPPEGYQWVKGRNGEPYVRRLPNSGKPQLRYDPQSDSFLPANGKYPKATFRETVTNDFTPQQRAKVQVAEDFYASVGKKGDIDGELRGIDFDGDVKVVNLPKGTVLESYAYVDKNGNPKTGSYFAPLGSDVNHLGIPVAGRQKFRVVLTEGGSFLRSNTADISSWKPGDSSVFAGGGIQLFRPGVPVRVLSDSPVIAGVPWSKLGGEVNLIELTQDLIDRLKGNDGNE